jgi:hypothetical protein
VDSFTELIQDDKDRPERLAAVRKTGEAFVAYFKPRVLWFKESTVKQVTFCYNLAYEKAIAFSTGERTGDFEALITANTEIGKAISQMESDFRELLGVITKPATARS